MAVASPGPYANNLHLAPDRQPHQHLSLNFTGKMLFLTQQQQQQQDKTLLHKKSAQKLQNYSNKPPSQFTWFMWLMACYKCFYLLTYWHKQYIKSKSSTNRKKILMSTKGLNIAAHIITQGKAVISRPDSSSIRDASSIKIQPGLEPVGAVAGARLSDRLSPTRSSPADWSASLLPDVPTSAATFLHAVPPPTSDAHKMLMWSCQ